MEMKIIGVISDTHGLIREEVKQALAGSDLIIHAGDIGSLDVLKELGRNADVVAVRGNVDRGEWVNKLQVTAFIEFEGINFYVIHDINQISIDPTAADVNIVISGHTHRPSEKRKEGILYLNPGSAGPRRFDLPISMALIRKYGDQIEVEFKKWC